MGALVGNEKEREAIEKAQDLKAQGAVVTGIRQAIAGQQGKVAALTSNYRSQLHAERTEALAAVARLEQEKQKSDYRQRILELKAPQDGVVKDLATTTKGAVVQPGMVLLTLVPRGERLFAEVVVKNDDIASVARGQLVRLKLAAYPFQKHGLVAGTVSSVAPDSRAAAGGAGMQRIGESPNETAGYRVSVELDLASFMGPQSSIKQLEPGMAVSAEIHQGTRTVMDYLLSPVTRLGAEAGRER